MFACLHANTLTHRVSERERERENAHIYTNSNHTHTHTENILIRQFISREIFSKRFYFFHHRIQA